MRGGSDITREEQSLADDKARAEIARLVAEAGHLNAQTAKIHIETRFYPVIAGAGFFAAVFTVAKLIV